MLKEPGTKEQKKKLQVLFSLYYYYMITNYYIF